MGKLNYEDKIKLYEERRSGLSIKSLSVKYGITTKNVQYLCCLIDRHGYDVLRTQNNKQYPQYIKQEAINRVLINNEAKWFVSLDLGFSNDGMLSNWIKKYKEMGYNIVERKRGRSPTMIKKNNKNETLEEKVKRLEEENIYLKAELEYSKKLRAVVQARKNRQQKKK